MKTENTKYAGKIIAYAHLSYFVFFFTLSGLLKATPLLRFY